MLFLMETISSKTGIIIFMLSKKQRKTQAKAKKTEIKKIPMED